MLANLLDFDLEGLAAFCAGLGEKRFRAVQLYRWIHQKGESDFERMSDLAKSLRAQLAATAEVRRPVVLSEHQSADVVVEASHVTRGGESRQTWEEDRLHRLEEEQGDAGDHQSGEEDAGAVGLGVRRQDLHRDGADVEGDGAQERGQQEESQR